MACCFFLLVAAAAVTGMARGGEEPRLSDLVESSRQHRRPLADFLKSPEPVSLEGDRTVLDLEIPLNSRLEMLGGEIEIYFRHGVELTPEPSRIHVSWDEREIASAEMGGFHRDGRIAGQLPAAEPGLNRHHLCISVDQGTAGASDEAAGSPWTQIDLLRSQLALDFRFRLLSPLLNEMRDLMDERQWTEQPLTLVTAPVYVVDGEHLGWGARVAQRAALWRGQQPLEIAHDDRLSGNGDEIVIGTREELIGVLPKAICDHITSSFVGVYPHPKNPRHFLLVISGTGREGVARAVRAFVFFPDRLPPLPRVDVTGWDLPERDPVPGGRLETRRVRMPDLARWKNEGFPGATGTPVVAGCDLWATHRDSQTIASAWMVAAKLAQVAGDVVTTLDVIDRRPDPGRHWIAFGDRNSLPKELAEMSPLDRVFSGGELIGRRGVLTQFESPLKKGRVAGFITADDRVLLEERVTELIRSDLWATLHGDTVVWGPGSESPRYQRLGAAFEIGEPGGLLLTWRRVSGLPWLSIMFGMGGAAIVAWLLMRPVHDPDPAAFGVTRRNGNRRVSRARRLREAARRATRLRKPLQHP